MSRLFKIAAAALPVALAASFATASDLYQVKDGPGGDGAGDLGYFLAGTGTLDRLRLNVNGGGNLLYDTGTFDFEIRQGDSGNFSPFKTYCLQAGVALGFDPGSDTIIDYKKITPISDDPRFSASTAEKIEILWHNAFALSQTSRVNAGAFQLLIWEFAQDGDSFDLAAGDLVVVPAGVTPEVNTFTTEVRDLALAWYAMIGDEWTERTPMPLGLLVNANFQDLIVEMNGFIIPLPSAGLMASVGLLGLASVRRRRLA